MTPLAVFQPGRRASRRWLARALALLLAGACCAGCQRRSDGNPSGAAPENAPADLTTPEDAARRVLLCLKAERQAIARRDRGAVRRLGQRLTALAAGDRIVRKLARQMRVLKLSRQRAVREFSKSWGAVVGYYLNGLALERLRRLEGSEDASFSVVLVPARGRDDSALIRVECARQADGTWRVADVAFEPEPAASRPADAAASP